MLHPEGGDDPSKYQTIEVQNPITGKMGLAIAHKPNGDCIYLGDEGCSIHDTAPLICQEFDCRRYVQRFVQGNRKAKLAAAKNNPMVREGMKRMKTL